MFVCLCTFNHTHTLQVLTFNHTHTLQVLTFNHTHTLHVLPMCLCVCVYLTTHIHYRSFQCVCVHLTTHIHYRSFQYLCLCVCVHVTTHIHTQLRLYYIESIVNIKYTAYESNHYSNNGILATKLVYRQNNQTLRSTESNN